MNQDKLDMQLLDFITGNLLPEEEEQIIAWMNESDENRQYYEQVQITHLQYHWFFRKKLIRGQKMDFRKLPVKRRRIIYYAASSAASVLLIISLFVAYLLQEPEEQNVTSHTTMIYPGTSKAKLLLSSGKRVLLGEEQIKIKDENDVEVVVNTPGEINYSTAKNIPHQESYHTLFVERGGEYRVTLADSSIVWLNSASELEYPTAFSGNERRVKLKGEAYFQVKANPESPFIVEVGQLTVKVTGTEFNINTHWNNVIETVLVKGKVNVKKGTAGIDLQPSQKVVYNTISGDMRKENINVEKYIAWRNGDFIFHEEPLGEIMDKLSLWYGCEVFFIHPALKNIRLSGDMKRYDKIDNLLFFFEESTGLKFETKGKTIVVKTKTEN